MRGKKSSYAHNAQENRSWDLLTGAQTQVPAHAASPRARQHAEQTPAQGPPLPEMRKTPSLSHRSFRALSQSGPAASLRREGQRPRSQKQHGTATRKILRHEPQINHRWRRDAPGKDSPRERGGPQDSLCHPSGGAHAGRGQERKWLLPVSVLTTSEKPLASGPRLPDRTADPREPPPGGAAVANQILVLIATAVPVRALREGGPLPGLRGSDLGKSAVESSPGDWEGGDSTDPEFRTSGSRHLPESPSSSVTAVEAGLSTARPTSWLCNGLSRGLPPCSPAQGPAAHSAASW